LNRDGQSGSSVSFICRDLLECGSAESSIKSGFKTAFAETQKALATKSERGPESYFENRTACYRKSTLGRISDARSGQIFHQPRYAKLSDEE
jgi:hypothetical protein